MSLFSPLIKRRKEKINSSTIFEGCYLKLWRKIWKFLALDNLCMLKKLNSIQTLVEDILEIKLSHLLSKTYKKSNRKIQTLIVLNKFVYYPNNCLVRLRILSLLRVNCSCSHFFSNTWNFIFFLLSFNNTDSILKSIHSVDCQDF